MRAEDLVLLLRRRPFQPFRLYVLEASMFEVRHAETAFVGRSTLTLQLPQDSQPDREIIIALVPSTRIEPTPLTGTAMPT